MCLKNKFLLVLSVSALLGCGETDLRAIYYNNTTSKKIKDAPIDDVQSGYLKALDIEPFQPEVYNNLGTTYDVLKDFEKALSLYKNTQEFAEKQNQESDWQENIVLALDKVGVNVKPVLNKFRSFVLMFVSNFNQGQLLGKEKKIKEALEKYQIALKYNPVSVEVKTNIELLIQSQQGQGKGDGQSDPNKGDGQSNDQKDQKQDKDGEGDKQQKKNYSSSPKYKPREFKGDMNKENVQKIFNEISQQEKKMRAQYSKKNQRKERPNEKDW